MGDDSAPTDNTVDVGGSVGYSVQAGQVQGGIDASTVTSRAVSLPALSVALGVVLALVVGFVVWWAVGATYAGWTPPGTLRIAGHPVATAGPPDTRRDASGQCVEEHLDEHLERYPLPVDVKARNLPSGSPEYPVAGILVRDGRTVGAVRLFYQHVGIGLQVLEVVDASCAPVAFSPLKRVARSDYVTTFEVEGQGYELDITVYTSISLEITLRLA